MSASARDEDQRMNIRDRVGICAFVLLTGVTSCGSGSNSTVVPTAATVPTTTTTTPSRDLEMSVAGCSAPPVTFALLCEVVDLLRSYHVEPPDDFTLAVAATAGIRDFASTRDPASSPRHHLRGARADFASFCEAVEERMEADLVPLQPMVESAVASMLVETVDPYTMYIPPELSGAVGEDGIIPGLSMVTRRAERGRITLRPDRAGVSSPGRHRARGRTAAEAGSAQGDVIEAIDGEEIRRSNGHRSGRNDVGRGRDGFAA